MKIPFISEMNERRQKKARAQLDNFANYYSIVKQDDYASTFFSLMGNARRTEEKSTKTLKKFISKSGWYEPLWIDNFMNSLSGLSGDEKRQKLMERSHYLKGNSFNRSLERWVDDAEPILQNIIEKNHDEMNSYEYYALFSGGGYGEGAIYRRVLVKEDNLYIKSFSGYGEHNFGPERTTAKDISREILKGILDKTVGNVNERRNNVIREIEKRTGRNLKKEVILLNASRNN
jgi:hypothetical protein